MVMQVCFLRPQAQAQTLVPDATLSTQVNPDGILGEFTVTGGQAQGVNLFHGFKTFSPGDWSVRFDLTPTPSHRVIERLFTRVTGGQPSIINGALSIVGGNSPDLFLLNPNGILFGPEAQLNLAGSFVGTTANAIQFADGRDFRATPLDGPPLLSISTPIGLQLGQNPGAIRVVGNGHNVQQDRNFQWRSAEPISGPQGLTIAPGNTLALVGGSVRFEGGQIQPRPGRAQAHQINAQRGTRLELGAVSHGVVGLQPEPRGWSLSYDAIQTFQDITLTNQSWLNSSSTDPSDVSVRGQNITLDQGSSIFLVNLGDQPNGHLDVFASGLLKLQGGGPIASYLQNVTLGPGRGGDTRIVSDRLQLLDGGAILALTVGAAGHAGEIDIDVTDSLQINGLSGTTTPTANPTVITNSTFGSGNVGMLDINARSINLDNGGIITSSTLGSGQGEVVQIEAEEQISLRGINPLSLINSNISAVSLLTGNASEELRVKTRRLEVLEGATISTDALGSGNSGSLVIEATEHIRIGGVDPVLSQLPAEISSAVIVEDLVATPLTSGEASGGSGSVLLQTPRLELFDRGRVVVSNQGSGNAGNLKIQAQTVNLLGQARIAATTAVGNGGNIQLSAGRALTLRDRSDISATAGGEDNNGNGGNIFIQTPQLIAVPQENSDITANAANRFGGAIEIDAATVLGLSVEPRQTFRSDITVSSGGGPQFSGTVELTQPQPQQNERLTALPSRFADQSDRLAQSCDAGRNQLSITSRRRLTQVDPEAQTLSQQYGDRGHTYQQQQQWQPAERSFIQALQISQAAQNPFQSYQWAWQLARLAQSRWKNTGNAQFRTESLAYYQESLNALKELRSDLANQDQAAEFSFRTNIEPVYREYVSLLLAPPSSQTQTAIPTQDLQTALNTIEALKLAELDNFFQDACLNSTPRSIETLDSSAAVVYPIILEDRIEVILSHQGKLQRHSIPITPDDFQALIRDFRSSLVQRRRRDYQQPGQQLYDVLIQPILDNLKQSQIQTLVFVPDKSLKNVPMGALFDGEEYLIEQFNVVVAPGLELLPGGRTTTAKSQALLAGITKRHQGFPPLPYVKQEIEQLQSLFPSQQLINEGFTRETLTRSLRETQTAIVHIATHGQFSSDASETYVLAWNEKIRLGELYELLQARDRESLTPTELLVLSACETAFGDEAAALGLAGVAVRAGARSTLASLWSVNDQSTAFLMKTFYQQLSQGGGNKSAALRQAQLELLKHPSYRDPYYWSAFVLIGNWQ